MKQRKDVEISSTWDLTPLYKTEDDFNTAVSDLKSLVAAFVSKYKNLDFSASVLNEALDEFQTITITMTHTSTYASLHMNADQSDEVNVMRMSGLQIDFASLQNELTFFKAKIMELDEAVLESAIAANEDNAPFIKDILRDKPHYLGAEQEKLLTLLSPVLDAPYGQYNRAKLADLQFPDFEVNGKTYPMSFVYYENELEFHEDKDVRHAAYHHFHKHLRKYSNTVASIYQAQVLKEKSIADARGYDSVIDYLLHSQKVSRDMYDRQIDLTMEHLAPHMRKFATLLKEIHGLDKMTFQDLKCAVDDDFEPNITIEESRDYILKGLAPLGEDYLAMLERAYDERWVDFPQNIGKSTGAFCNSPYGNHPYILINWTERMREVFVLAHEFGHAGHFYLAGQNNSVYGTRASTYFIEAPSTMNELIMADYLMKQKDEPRFKRWVLASMVSRTYYHNFVTHLLEAAYQREVYRLVDAGKPLSAAVLNNLKRNVLETFWGDAVEITEGAELTWMRQPHYYMGLYPYTYSAGLTIATQASQKIINNEMDVNIWLDVLKTGGTKTPLELAQMAGVDMSNDDAIVSTIDRIGAMIQEIIDLS